jgi:hypothetical protein
MTALRFSGVMMSPRWRRIGEPEASVGAGIPTRLFERGLFALMVGVPTL